MVIKKGYMMRFLLIEFPSSVIRKINAYILFIQKNYTTLEKTVKISLFLHFLINKGINNTSNLIYININLKKNTENV